jgi:predicted phage terminase large subunit-like protein
MTYTVVDKINEGEFKTKEFSLPPKWKRYLDIVLEREKYRENFYLFCRDVLGYKEMNDEHRQLCSILQDEPLYTLILMPRYSYKSCIATVGKTLWDLSKNYDMRVLIYSDAASKAKAFLGDIKNHIMGKSGRSRFREVFGQWEVDPKKGKWNEEQVVIAYRRTAHKEPSVDTGGIETSKAAFHYDKIIFDDIVTDVNVTTKAQMDKTAECYKKALSLLKPGGSVLMLGTRWDYGDLYGRIIAENKETQLFTIHIRDAEDRNTEGQLLFDSIGLTRAFLDRQRREQGSRLYSCLYRNEPTDDETAIFKAKDFAFEEAVGGKDLYVTCTIDPAGEGEDFTAITVVGTDHEMNMHLLDIINAHLLPSQMIDKIINLNYKYKFKMLGIETNFYRGMLKLELDNKIMAEHQTDPKTFPLFGTQEFLASSRRGENKFSRIRALQPYHERGAIKFPGKQIELLSGAYSELAYQMLQFPNAAHDDVLDSLAYHLPLIRKGGLAKKKEPPVNTPAWLEKQAYLSELKHMNRLPRRLRGNVAPLSLS